MSADRRSIPVSLPEDLVRELDELVEEGAFGSRSEALRYGARLVTREAHLKRLHELTAAGAERDIEERLERKRVS
ncbi:ribbon-helix-helix domain-containing protein [Halomarina pelagica]|uniref:ribbon-helix-helix domain-containing protein n=1 Tax=Halomarina pelagica TaxID=2961599 RepID=UPI0020C2817B|nr:ribbon-helix-helix domain-containing protein [Halomarina sp. BND7]